MIPHPAVIAAHDARRKALVLRDIGGEGAPIAGGWMSCDRPGSWASFAAGMGVDEPVPAEAVDRLVAFYAERGRPAAVEATPYQHPTLFEALGARGFVVADLETVLVRPTQALDAPPRVPGLAVRAVDPRDPGAVEAFVALQCSAFHDDPSTLDAFAAILRRAVRYSASRTWLLELHGETAGGGGLELIGPQATLFGGAVLPDFRRRGLQRALIALRLAEAAAHGATWALVGSAPGHTTERNALRAGFRVAYTQMLLKRSLPWRPMS